jgi:hopanoid biosynthesis associated RND transporter like protein HpnN
LLEIRRKLLGAWVAWTLLRPRLILGAVAAVSVACVIYSAQELDFQTSQLDLISREDPIVKLAQEVKPFQAKDTFTVVIEAPTPRRAIEFLNSVRERIEGDPSHFKDAFFRVDPDLLRPWALLYTDKKDLDFLSERIDQYPTLIQGIAHRPDLTNFLDLVNQEMASRMVQALFTDFLRLPKEGEKKAEEPMDLGFLIATLQGVLDHLEGNYYYLSPWSSFFKEGFWDRELEGYFWVAEKKFLLFFVTPVREKETFNRARKSLEYLRKTLEDVRRSFPDVQVGVTGQEALKTDEMTVALEDMSWATWISFGGVWILNVLFFKSHTRTIVRMIVLAIGLCWTFGFLTLTIGHLNILSMVFAPMLVGLGDDYAVHWFARLEEEERALNTSRREAIVRVAEKSGPAILTAGISGALSFLPLVLTGFKGLVELGLISGTGILIQVVVDFLALPPLSLLGKTPRRKEGEGEPSRDFLRLNRKKAAIIMAAALGVSGVSLFGALRVGFDLNPLRLQAMGTESVVWEERLRENSKRSVLFATSWASSLEELKTKTEGLKSLPVVWKVQSLLSLLPEEQEEKLPLVREISERIPQVEDGLSDSQPMDPEKIVDLLERIRFKMDDSQAESWGARRPVVEQIAQVRDLTGRILEAIKGADDAVGPLAKYQESFVKDLMDVFDLISSGKRTSLMTLEDIPESLKERFVSNGKYLIRIFPSEDIWEPEPRERFVAEVRSLDPNAVGDAVTLHVYSRAYQKACLDASIYALIGIWTLLFLEFRGSMVAAVAFLPLFFGTLWTVGLMKPLGVSFNLANSVFLPLIVGAGVEYGIIIVHRWREGMTPPGSLPLSTAKGVICASLTTNLGFGTLMICRHQGIFSLGVLSFAGSMLVLLAAVVVLPATMAFLKRPKRASKEE